jgi:hypothetical protein
VPSSGRSANFLRDHACADVNPCAELSSAVNAWISGTVASPHRSAPRISTGFGPTASRVNPSGLTPIRIAGAGSKVASARPARKPNLLPFLATFGPAMYARNRRHNA